jgi:hypothetical protein
VLRATALDTMVDRVRAHLTDVCRDGAEQALDRLKALLHDPSPDDDTLHHGGSSSNLSLAGSAVTWVVP